MSSIRTRPLLVILALTGSAALATLAWRSAASRTDRLAALRHDQVHSTTLDGIRLGDAVPLDIRVALRWRAGDATAFAREFTDPESYGRLVLEPRAREAAGRVANRYADVSRVFGGERQAFVEELKEAMGNSLADPALARLDVVIADLAFPDTFTHALEARALQSHELEGVRQENAIALERMKSAQQQAEADGKVAIARAEAEGKVAEITARTEEKQRATALARAETEAQVIERKARAEAGKQRLLAEAEADRLDKLGDSEARKQAKLRDVEVGRKRAEKDIEVEREQEVAALLAENPPYASFLVSRELASKVQIAVLPTGSDPGTLGTLLQTMTPTRVAEGKRR